MERIPWNIRERIEDWINTYRSSNNGQYPPLRGQHNSIMNHAAIIDNSKTSSAIRYGRQSYQNNRPRMRRTARSPRRRYINEMINNQLYDNYHDYYDDDDYEDQNINEITNDYYFQPQQRDYDIELYGDDIQFNTYANTLNEDQRIEAMILRGRLYGNDGKPGDKIYGKIAEEGETVKFPQRNLPTWQNRSSRNSYVQFDKRKPINSTFRSTSPRRQPRFLQKQQQRIQQRSRSWQDAQSRQMRRNSNANRKQEDREVNELDQYDEYEATNDYPYDMNEMIDEINQIDDESYDYVEDMEDEEVNAMYKEYADQTEEDDQNFQ
jgi:hypothetical protein